MIAHEVDFFVDILFGIDQKSNRNWYLQNY